MTDTREKLYRAAAQVFHTHGIHITPEVQRDLDKAGIPTFPGTKTITDYDPSDCALIGAVWYAPEKLQLPDNLVEPCHLQCGRMIQYRPNMKHIRLKVCMYCAATIPKVAS